ncbi:MAG: InlB B-repeat-containing protein, partial [Clostridia bacterium]|nr:InlB B-repeat-containing protein [Clostridia bacterium]
MKKPAHQMKRTCAVILAALLAASAGTPVLPVVQPISISASALEPVDVGLQVDGPGYYINMPGESEGEKILDLRDVGTAADGFSFHVYDDGGRTGEYSYDLNSQLRIIAPDGCRLYVSGKVKTYYTYGDDYLAVYDSDDTLIEKHYTCVSGGWLDITPFTSSGSEMLLDFVSDSYGVSDGLDLYVTVVSDGEHNVNKASGLANGDITLSDTSAAVGTTVTVTASPDSGYRLERVNVLDKNGNTVPTIGGMLGGECTFVMPPVEVEVGATFTSATDSSLYYTIPSSGTVETNIPSDITSFKIYDYVPYANNTDGKLVLNAPEGYGILLEGSVNLKDSGDTLTVKDSSGSVAASMNGTFGSVSKVYSGGRTLTLELKTNSIGRERGCDLTAKLYSLESKKSIERYYSISNGSLLLSPSEALPGEKVTMKVVPDAGYVVYNVGAWEKSTSNSVPVTVDWTNNEISFIMPNDDIVLLPNFTNNRTYNNLYINMPKTGTKELTIPDGVESFYLFDDGGNYDSYSDNANGKLVIHAPEGQQLDVKQIYASIADAADYLEIFAVNGETREKLAELNNAGSYFEYLPKTARTLEFAFKSNNLGHDSGFQLAVSLTDGTVMGNSHNISKIATANGTISIQKNGKEVTSARKGEKITVTAAPAAGYVLNSIYCLDDYSSNPDIALKNSYRDTTETVFTMPDYNIGVYASFIKEDAVTNGDIWMFNHSNTTFEFTDGVTSLNIYDEGGPAASYGNSCESLLTLSAPEGKIIKLASDSFVTENNYDRLYVYNGTAAESKNLLATYQGGSDESPIVFDREFFGTVTLRFHTDGSVVKKGFAVTATLVDAAAKTITCTADPNCEITAPASASEGDTVTVSGTPVDGFVFNGVSVKTDSGNPVEYTGGWYCDNKVTFEMPNDNVTVTPIYVPKEDAYVNIPKNGVINVKPPKDITSFHVYDDGGIGNSASVNCCGAIVVTAPEGVVYKMNGKLSGYYGGMPKFGVYNSENTDLTKELDQQWVYHYTYWGDYGINEYTLANVSTIAFSSPTSSDLELEVKAYGSHTYTVNTQKSENGTVTAAATANSGSVVSAKFTPNDGYALAGFKVIDKNGNNIPTVGGIAEVSDVGTFVMPNTVVTIIPEFVKNDAFALTVPEMGLSRVTVTDPDHFHFKVYDHGGADGDYNSDANGALALTAPEGYVFEVSGTESLGYTEDGRYGKLSFFEDDSFNKTIHSDEGTGGDVKAIKRIVSSSNTILLDLTNEGGAPAAKGIDLDVSIVPKDAAYSINVVPDEHGTLTVNNPRSYKAGERVRMRADAEEGYFLADVEATDAHGVPVTVDGGWYADGEIVFDMPASDVTLTPIFTNDATAEGGLFINESGSYYTAVIPAGVESFYLYDDGGKDGMMSPGSYSREVRLADDYGEKCLFHVNGTVALGRSDYLSMSDGMSSFLNFSYTSNTVTVDAYSQNPSNILSVNSYIAKYCDGYALKVTAEKMNTGNITIEEHTGGTLTASKKKASTGDAVIFSSVPDTGFILADVLITPEGGDTFSLTKGFTFDDHVKYTMGSKPITVTPVYTNEFTAEGGLYKLLSTDTAATLSVPSSIKSFKLYDDGGKDGNYDATTPSGITIESSDTNVRFNVSGTITAAYQSGLYDSTQVLHISRTSGDSSIVSYNSRANGEETSIGSFTTPYNTAYFSFWSDYTVPSFEGLDLTVNVVDSAKNNTITINSAEHGVLKAKNTADADITEAVFNDVVTLKPENVDDGYVLADVIITDENGFRIPFSGGWYNSNIVTFSMPASAVEVTPVFTNDLTAEGGLYVNLQPDLTADKDGSENFDVNIPSGVKSFRVYDDGGKDGQYSRRYIGEARLIAETGKKLEITGSYSLANYGDSLNLYNDEYSGVTSYTGKETGNVTPVLSLNNKAKIGSNTDDSKNAGGFNLLVRVFEPTEEYTVSKGASDNGSISFAGDAQTLSAQAGSTVLFEVTPDEGYLVTDVIAQAGDEIIETYGGRWYSGTTTVSFNMPAADVTITPVYTTAHSAEDGLFINMPKKIGSIPQTISMVIPDGVTSFKLYDDGGKDGSASADYYGRVQFKMKDRYHPSVNGTIFIQDGYSDHLYMYRDLSESDLVYSTPYYYNQKVNVSAENPNSNTEGTITLSLGSYYTEDGIDLTVTAAPDYATIYFYSEGGSFVDDIDGTMNYTVEGVEELPKMTRHGYKHTGWTLDGVNYVTSLSPDDAYGYISTRGDISMTAGWEVDLYRDFTLSEHMAVAESTEPPVDGRYKVGSVVTVKLDEGYEAVGDLNDGTNDIAIEDGVYKITIADPDVTVTGTIKPVDYTVTYEDVDGAKNENPVSYNIESDDITLGDASKTGYTFTGWTYDAVTTPEKNVKISKGSTGDKTFKANWTVNSYTVTFDPDNGSDKQTLTVDFDKEITAPADPTREGYTFAGWDKDIPAKMPAENLTFKAKWNVNSYTITFDTKGGSKIAPITQDY